VPSIKPNLLPTKGPKPTELGAHLSSQNAQTCLKEFAWPTHSQRGKFWLVGQYRIGSPVKQWNIVREIFF
jgi:hypothetical protein